MAPFAVYLTIVVSASFSTGFKLSFSNGQFSQHENSNFPIQPFQRKVHDVNEGPIAGYPKAPPPNAYESGGQEGDLLPPFSDANSRQVKSLMSRSIGDAKVDPKTGYPYTADPLWKFAGGNGDTLQLPLEELISQSQSLENEAVDLKTGYPLTAQPEWREAGGDESILQLPLEENVAGNSEKKVLVDPKTGYPLIAEESWKYAGGTGDVLDVPLDDQNADKKVDPKTGYPLSAEESWKFSGGTGDILDAPLEDSNSRENPKVDPKTGYPLVAESSWKFAGGTGDILQLPNAEPSKAGKVDPKTGYPLVAEAGWEEAGGTGDVLELPNEDPAPGEAVDPKTGYPLKAQPDWKDAGGNEDILDLPDENEHENEYKGKIDPKTGYPIVAQPEWAEAGGNQDTLELPLNDGEEKVEVDPKTGYPLVADPKWALAGGDASVLSLPVEGPTSNGINQEGQSTQTNEKVEIFDESALTELRPPPIESSFSTGFGDASNGVPAADTTTTTTHASLQTSTDSLNEFLGNFATPLHQQHQQQIVSIQPSIDLSTFFNSNGQENDVFATTPFFSSAGLEKQLQPIERIGRQQDVVSDEFNRLILTPNHVFARSPVPIVFQRPTVISHRAQSGRFENVPSATSYQITSFFRRL